MFPLLHDCHIHIHRPEELKHVSALRAEYPVLHHGHLCSGRWGVQAQVPSSTLWSSAHPRESPAEKADVREEPCGLGMAILYCGQPGQNKMQMWHWDLRKCWPKCSTPAALCYYSNCLWPLEGWDRTQSFSTMFPSAAGLKLGEYEQVHAVEMSKNIKKYRKQHGGTEGSSTGDPWASSSMVCLGPWLVPCAWQSALGAQRHMFA